MRLVCHLDSCPLSHYAIPKGQHSVRKVKGDLASLIPEAILE